MDINYLFDQGHKNLREACGHVEKPKAKLGLHDRASQNFWFSQWNWVFGYAFNPFDAKNKED